MTHEPRIVAALKALLPEVDSEIDQRKTSGNDEYWADLQRLSDEGHAAVRAWEDATPGDGALSVLRQVRAHFKVEYARDGGRPSIGYASDALAAAPHLAPAQGEAVEVGDVDEAYLEEVADGAWGDDPRTRGLARDRLAALRAAPHLAPAQGEAGRVCATESCDKPATVHFERGGIGSDYCIDCATIIKGMTSPAGTVAAGAEAPPRDRLNQLGRMERRWREVAEAGDKGTEPLPQALDALKEAIRIAKAERRRADAALRAALPHLPAATEWRSMDSAPRDGTLPASPQGERAAPDEGGRDGE